jgi:hypothetical protein
MLPCLSKQFQQLLSRALYMSRAGPPPLKFPSASTSQAGLKTCRALNSLGFNFLTDLSLRLGGHGDVAEGEGGGDGEHRVALRLIVGH